MALSDPSVLQRGIAERHPSECSRKLPVPLEVNIAGRNLKITDYNELFDLNKINGNSRRITTLTIKTVSTYKQKVDSANGLPSDRPPSPPSRTATSGSQVNNRPFNQNKQAFEETSQPRRLAESNKDFQFNCANGNSHIANGSNARLSDKENNSLNQVLKSAGDSARGDLRGDLRSDLASRQELEHRKIKQISIKKSIEVEPKRPVGASTDDQQLNYKGQRANDQSDFQRNQRRSSSLRQINLFTKHGNAELRPNEPLDGRDSYFVSGKFNEFDNRNASLAPMTSMPQRLPRADQKGREFYFNGTNKLYKDELDDLGSRLSRQKMSAGISEPAAAANNPRFREQLNASLNSSFNSNYNYNKDGNNNSSLKRANYAGSASSAVAGRQSHHQYPANSPQLASQQLKQSNQFSNPSNPSYLEQHQQPNQQVIRKKLNRKLSAGGNAIDEINSDEFVNELKSKISSNHQTTSSPETAAKRNQFSLNSLDRERKNHLILDTSTMPHLSRRVDTTTANVQQQTLPPTGKPSFITSTVRRNESFQKATEHRIRMEPRSQSVRSTKDSRHAQAAQPPAQQAEFTARVPPSGQPISLNSNADKLDSQLGNNKNSQRFSFLGSQAANGYQRQTSNDNLANETCTTDDWNTTLDTNAETRSSTDDRSRQYKKCDKYGFFIDEDATKSGRTGSIKREDEQTKRRNLEVDKRREKKWLEMLQKWDYYMDKRWNKICERCRKGIPPSLRGVAWIHLCAAHKKKRNNPELFSILNQKPGNESINDEIVKDLHRQFPSHEMFAGTNTEGQQDLFIVLKNFSIFNQEVGYCQGLAPIVCVLLMHLPSAEDVFFVLVQLCDHYLPGYFSAGLETIQMHCQMLNSFLKRHNNTVYKILKKQKIDPSFYALEWFMCVFARTLPWPTVLRIWDMFFCEGIIIVFRVALVILASLEPDFKRAKCNSNDKLVETMEILKNLPKKYLELDYLLPRVIQMDLSEKDLDVEHISFLKRLEKQKQKQIEKQKKKKK